MNRDLIFITNLPLIKDWEFHYNDLSNQCHNYVGPWMQNNFPIKDTTGIWDNLYQQFLDKTVELFGSLEIFPSNKRTCWLYMSNKNYYKGGIHDHVKTSVINAVYYFSVPFTSNEKDGAIAFYNTDHKEIFFYKPKEGDLLIFPNYFLHQPLPTSSEKYRFSINMEIQCTWPMAFGEIPY